MKSAIFAASWLSPSTLTNFWIPMPCRSSTLFFRLWKRCLCYSASLITFSSFAATNWGMLFRRLLMLVKLYLEVCYPACVLICLSWQIVDVFLLSIPAKFSVLCTFKGCCKSAYLCMFSRSHGIDLAQGFMPHELMPNEVNWFYLSLGINNTYFTNESNDVIVDHIALFSTKVLAYTKYDPHWT